MLIRTTRRGSRWLSEELLFRPASKHRRSSGRPRNRLFQIQSRRHVANTAAHYEVAGLTEALVLPVRAAGDAAA